MKDFTPKEIVNQLDRYIIGQDSAKRSVAIALRNRYRRSQLDEELREEITPKNIIMMGPTGVGKTEIARRLAKIVDAPFIKIEATKFTEVGYVGRDVESMVRDLIEAAIRMVKNEKMINVREKALNAAEERILEALLPTRKKKSINPFGALFLDSDSEQIEDKPEDEQEENTEEKLEEKHQEDAIKNTREKFRLRLRSGKLEDKFIEIEVDEAKYPGVGAIPNMGNEDMMIQIQDVFGNIFPKKTKKKKVSIREARRIFEQEEAQKIIDMDEVIDEAVYAA
ncbi:MAG: AAA family ATPase, partial [Firmicutes bacterium]|nr:AAA family ATPase [Bacillota bacterium]